MSMFKKYALSLNDSENMLLAGKEGEYILSQTLDYWKSPEDIKADVLPEIDLVLSGELEEGEVDADVVGLAIFDSSQTFLGNSGVGYPNMILPTKDFRQLWLEWIELLEANKQQSEV